MEICKTGVGLLLVGALVGCGGKNRCSDTTQGIGDSAQQSIPKVDPELCDTSSKRVETFDLNQDNRPDVWRLFVQMEEDDRVRIGHVRPDD